MINGFIENICWQPFLPLQTYFSEDDVNPKFSIWRLLIMPRHQMSLSLVSLTQTWLTGKLIKFGWLRPDLWRLDCVILNNGDNPDLRCFQTISNQTGVTTLRYEILIKQFVVHSAGSSQNIIIFILQQSFTAKLSSSHLSLIHLYD